MPIKGNCIVGQSGGPTAVINASLAGVIAGALENAAIDRVYGAVNGIEGVLKRKFAHLNSLAGADGFLNLLKHTPAAYLGSCRYKLPRPEDDSSIYEEIFNIFKENNICYFFYIGGNDSMDTVAKLSAYARKTGYPVNIIGVPKTIDNDLLCTDHTPGYGSAAKYIASTVREIGLDSDVYDLDSVTVVEIMGRNAGWLAAASALARGDGLLAPHLIYLPETEFSDEAFFNDVRAVWAKGIRNVVVVVSEGIRYKNGRYVCEDASSGLTDTFGHKCLSGTAKVLENKVRNILGCKARGVEVNVSQRCAAHLMSKTDMEEAELIGRKAVEEAVSGSTGKMMVYVRRSSNPYKIDIESRDIDSIANGEKVVPREWINAAGNDITEEFILYARPLTFGEPAISFKDGVPVYLKLTSV